jgi:sRNA-binding carbon storage regulator CsrA
LNPDDKEVGKLALRRRGAESIVIDDRFRVTLVKPDGARIVLAIEAPRDVAVDREDVWIAKQRAREAGAREDEARTTGRATATGMTTKTTTGEYTDLAGAAASLGLSRRAWEAGMAKEKKD